MVACAASRVATPGLRQALIDEPGIEGMLKRDIDHVPAQHECVAHAFAAK